MTLSINNTSLSLRVQQQLSEHVDETGKLPGRLASGLQQAASAMLVQANGEGRSVLALLR